MSFSLIGEIKIGNKRYIPRDIKGDMVTIKQTVTSTGVTVLDPGTRLVQLLAISICNHDATFTGSKWWEIDVQKRGAVDRTSAIYNNIIEQSGTFSLHNMTQWPYQVDLASNPNVRGKPWFPLYIFGDTMLRFYCTDTSVAVDYFEIGLLYLEFQPVLE